MANTQLRGVHGDPRKAKEVSYSHAPLFATGRLTGFAGLRANPFEPFRVGPVPLAAPSLTRLCSSGDRPLRAISIVDDHTTIEQRIGAKVGLWLIPVVSATVGFTCIVMLNSVCHWLLAVMSSSLLLGRLLALSPTPPTGRSCRPTAR